MAILAAVVVPPPLLEDQHLLALDLPHHFGGDDGTRRRQVGVGAVADHERLAKRHAGAGLAGKALDGDDVVLGHFVLFAAGADHCEHGRSFVLKIERRAKPSGRAHYSEESRPVNVLPADRWPVRLTGERPLGRSIKALTNIDRPPTDICGLPRFSWQDWS